MAKYLDLTGLTYFLSKITANFVAKETGKGLSSNDFTTAEKNKLAGIEAGAEVNVQSDWNAVSGDAMILNKPTIPTVVSTVTAGGTDAINSVALIAYINSLDADNTEY